jgi:hypothetical protein
MKHVLISPALNDPIPPSVLEYGQKFLIPISARELSFCLSFCRFNSSTFLAPGMGNGCVRTFESSIADGNKSWHLAFLGARRPRILVLGIGDCDVCNAPQNFITEKGRSVFSDIQANVSRSVFNARLVQSENITQKEILTLVKLYTVNIALKSTEINCIVRLLNR